MDRLVQDHDQATSLWAIPHAVQNIIDTFFRYRLDVEYDTLDVSLLAWMRFWIMQQHYPVQSYLPWFVQQQWPLVWYAPLIGALHADVDDEIC
jgi:hypothetical protein